MNTLSPRQTRLLIVDDHDFFADTVAAIAYVEGRLEVVGRARNGHEALALARELAPDLIVMDVEMPLMDGIEATRRLRRRGFAAPILAISGSDIPDVEHRMLRAGATCFVSKCRAAEELIPAVRAALDARADSDDELVFAC
jgi:DNA-binding NarL/FixJ family response regulator